MPTFDEMMHMLDIKISIFTVWRWLKHLGYHSDENKSSYYTDRYDILDDCNNIFLLDYLKAERRTYYLVQIDSMVSIEIEKID